MNTKEKGDKAVGVAIAYYSMSNIEVLLPIGDKKPYDFVIDRKGKLLKVQCKFAGQKTPYGMYKANLRVKGGNQSFHTTKFYKPGDFDLLFCLTGDGRIFEVPSKKTNKLKNAITLGKKYKLHQKKLLLT